MSRSTVVLLFVGSVLLLAPLRAVEAKWSCGTDETNERFSREMVERDCPQLKLRINRCCHEHDKCYERQLGQTACDTAFCNCMQVYTKPSPVCSLNESNLFCSAVRLFGALRYAQAGNKD